MAAGRMSRRAPARQVMVSGLLALATVLTFLGGISAPILPARATVTLTGWTVDSGSSSTSSTPGTPLSGAPASAPAAVTALPGRDAASDKVGATVGEFRVSEDGAATYRVPIYTPPGRAGVAPQLAVSYSTRGTSTGPLAQGFSLEGLSAISRCRLSREAGDFLSDPSKDGDPHPVDFTATDAFCLDGQRLLATNDTVPTGGGLKVFYSELDPFTRVIAHGASLTDPDYFRVQRKDGSTSWYGQGRNARLTVSAPGGATPALTWAINHFQDSLGNAILYNYDQPTGTAGELLVSSVQYTATATAGQPAAPSTSDSGFASITFNYSTMADVAWNISYVSGALVTHSRQLDTIEVFDGATKLRRYNLSYQNSLSLSTYRQLSQIEECSGLDTSVCYRPTVFTWSPARYTFETNSEQTPAGTNFDSMVSYKLADVDGDGRPDLVWWKDGDGCTNSRSKLYVSFADRAGSQFTYITKSTGYCAPRDLANNDDTWQTFDYDGDGRDDLMLAGAAGGNWKLHLASATVGSRNTPFNTGVDQLATDGMVIPVPTEEFRHGQFADFNGDGLLDIMVPDTVQGSNTYGSLVVRFLEKQVSGLYKFSSTYLLSVDYPDTSDLCNVSDTECYFEFYNWQGKRTGITNEANGDGRADLLIRVQRISGVTMTSGGNTAKYATEQMLSALGPLSPTATTRGWYVFVAGQRIPANGPNAAVFHMHAAWNSSTNIVNTGTMPQTSDGVYLADFNADGLNDILYKSTSSNQYNLLLNTGTSFLPYLAVTGIENGTYLQIADVDGDGRADLLYPPGTQTSSRPFKVRHWQYSASNPAGTFSAATDIPGGGATATYMDQWAYVFADVDGDGATDFVRLQRSGGTSTNFLYASRANAGERYRARDAITKIANGYGATTELTYQPLTNHAVYRRDAGSRDSKVWGRGAPVQDLLAPMYVVSQASSSAPTETNAAALSTVRYRYEGAKLQGGGRGFLGFRRVQSVDTNDYAAGTSVDGYVWSRTDYQQDFPFIGMPVGTEKFSTHTALTFGNAHLDACFADIETGTETCFTNLDPATTQPFSNLAGALTSTAGQIWQCRGNVTGDAACPAQPGGNYCSMSGALAARFNAMANGPVKPLEAIDPTIPQQPIFPRLYGTVEANVDPNAASGGVNHLAFVSFCHDAYGNVTHSETDQQDGAGTTVARKTVDNVYTNTSDTWRLGRLTTTNAHSIRSPLSAVDRTANFVYAGTGTGLLTSEKVTQSDNANLTLRTLTDYDTYGNKTYVYSCSADLTDTQCKNLTTLKHRPVGTSGPTTTVQRFAHTTYDGIGRYPTATKTPYFDPTVATKQWTERASSTIVSRGEFGDVTEQIDANNLHTRIAYGYLGREYARNDDTGASATKTYRWCTDVGVTCPSGAVFREEAKAAGAPSKWTYYDVLGRVRMSVTESFNAGIANKDLSAACTFHDAHNRAIKTTEPFFLTGTAVNGTPNLNGTECGLATSQTRTDYDVIGRVTKATRPDTSTEQYTYTGLTTQRKNGLNKTWSETKNALGETLTLSDPAGFTINHDYDSEGKLITVRRDAGAGQITTSVFYDALGRKTKQIDPDLGTWTYEYNAAGELIRQTDAKGQVIEQDFDALGRVWRRTVRGISSGPGCPAVADRLFCNGFELGSTASAGTVVHTSQFDTAPNGIGLLDFDETQQADGSVYRRVVTYDALGRFSTRATLIDGATYSESINYDSLGRVSQQYDASPDMAGSGVQTGYNTRGYPETMTALGLPGVGLLNKVTEHNARGQVTKEQRAGLTAMEIVRTYDPFTGRPDTVCAGANCVIQDADYDFDVEGNLTAREKNKVYQGGLHAYREEFVYDDLNRLTTAKLTKIDGVVQGTPLTQTSLGYDKLGNICQKNGQAYTYGGPSTCAGSGGSVIASPHAAKTAFGKTYTYDFNGNLVFADAAGTANDRTLNYTAENLASSIKTTTAEAHFLYGADQLRYKRTDVRTSGANAGTTLTRYVGNLEIITLPSGTLQVKRYIGGVAMLVSQGGVVTPYYLFTDHLGSIERLTNASGSVIEAMNFDAHGNRRDAADWQGPPATTPQLTTHGFVGLEHLDDFGFVHMNGRIYDAELGRFVQADSQIEQDATQGLNRYTYVLNNPLSYTDPSGHSIGGFFKKYWRAIAAIAITIFAPYLLPALQCFWGAVAVGFVSGCVATGSLQGGLYGAFSAGLFYGIGSAFSGMQGSGNFAGSGLSPGAYAGKVLAHGVAGGVMSELQGDTFGHGFVSAGVTQAFSGKIDGIDKYNEGFSPGRTFAAAMLGGTVSATTGGKFANGAITAAFSRAFNDEAHPRSTDGGGYRDYDKNDPNYHEYSVMTEICDSAQQYGCSAQYVFDEGLDRHSAPFLDGSYIEDLEVRPLTGFGPVRFRVYAADMTIINETMPAHMLAPGYVERRVIEIDGKVYIKTFGAGIGTLGSMNIATGNLMWHSVDTQIASSLKAIYPPTRIVP